MKGENRFYPMTILQQQQGVALLIVLWVMAMLTVIVGQFCYSMRSEVNITRNFRDSTRAYYLARSGIQQALLELLEPVPEKSEEDEPDFVPPWRVNVDNPPVALDDGTFKVRIGNVSGRININLASAELLKLVAAGLDLDDEQIDILVDSIQDWRDADTFHRLNGAENDYYERLSEPYSSHDGPFRSLEELRLVRGVTPDVLKAAKAVCTIYPKVMPEKKKKRKKKKGKRKKTSTEQKTININAAPVEVLRLLPTMTEEAIEAVLAFRSSADFRVIGEVQTAVGGDIYSQISRYISLDSSSYYTFLAAGMVKDSSATSTIYTVVDIDVEKKEYRYVQWLDSVTTPVKRTDSL